MLLASFVSYSLNLPSCWLQVAAVDTPKLHLWETGVIRITRHPQCFGQFLWCAAHCLWIGNSFMVTTSAGLMAHHFFSCWHGDFRQRRKYGEVGPQTLRTALQGSTLLQLTVLL